MSTATSFVLAEGLVTLDETERAARIRHVSQGTAFGDMMRRKNTGYAQCYRCTANASTHVRMPITSLIPVCLDHLAEAREIAAAAFGA